MSTAIGRKGKGAMVRQERFGTRRIWWSRFLLPKIFPGAEQSTTRRAGRVAATMAMNVGQNWGSRVPAAGGLPWVAREHELMWAVGAQPGTVSFGQ